MADTYGYLGPEGTFSEEALLYIAGFKKEDLIPYGTVEDVIRAVEEDKVSKGIVPIENSIEGSVNATLDMLIFESDLLIEKEIIMPIKHNLITHAGIEIEKIEKIISHPQATAQCRKYLQRYFKDIPHQAANSTSEAVAKTAEGKPEFAAIGTSLAAEIYNLQVFEEDIADFKDNKTRFLLIGKEKMRKTGHDKTTLICFIYEDRPGMLLQILQEFAFRYINLTKIQSRPTKEGLGKYCFYIDLEGHIEDEEVSSAVKCLECKIRNVKLLGSYPRGDINAGS